MKKIILIFICFFTINVYAKTGLKGVSFVKCIDGDTAIFKEGDKEVKYRFLAIDTPEINKGDSNAETASLYTCDKLTNAEQIIVEQESSNYVDKYGRSLGWIWVDGSLLQQELIEKGYAKVAYIYGEYRYTESLCYLQSSAIENKLGIWNGEIEEGYCSSIDYKKENNISFENITNGDGLDTEKYEKIFNKVEKTEGKVLDYFDSSDSYIYIFLGVAFVVMLYNFFKH